MTKSNKYIVLLIILKIVLFCVVFSLYGEYIISREIPGFFQLIATLIMIAFVAIMFESILKNVKNINTGVRNQIPVLPLIGQLTLKQAVDFNVLTLEKGWKIQREVSVQRQHRGSQPQCEYKDGWRSSLLKLQEYSLIRLTQRHGLRIRSTSILCLQSLQVLPAFIVRWYK